MQIKLNHNKNKAVTASLADPDLEKHTHVWDQG